MAPCLHVRDLSSTSTPRPSAAPAAWLAGPASRSSTSPAATRRCRSSGRRCAWPAWPAPTTSRCRGSTTSSTPSATRSASSTASPRPVWDALRRGEAPDLLTLAQKAASGAVAVPPARGQGRHRGAQGRRARRSRRGIRDDRPAARHPRPAGQAPRRPEAEAVDLPHRRHRRHLRGHPAGPAGRPRGRRHHRRDPLHGAEPARLRARGRHPRGLRRHLRHAGELPADAGRARRVEQGARPLRAPDQLRLRPVHARDRGPGRASSGST